MVNDISKLLHQANSNLAVVYGYLQLLERSLSQKELTKEDKWVKETLKAYKNLQKIINQLEKTQTN
jgi:hypothetical protein